MMAVIFSKFYANADFLGEEYNNLNATILNVTNSYLLPNNVKPLRYDIFLEISDLNESKTYTGFVAISLKLHILREKKIILHSKNLNVTVMSYLSDNDFVLNNNTVYICNVSQVYDVDPQYDYIIFHLIEKKFIPYCVLLLKFSGNINELEGLTYQSYRTENGQISHFLTTNLKPIGARSFFPCFDEPKYKTEFHVNIFHDPNYSWISNGETIYHGHNEKHNKTMTAIVIENVSTFMISLTMVKNDSWNKYEYNLFKLWMRKEVFENNFIKYSPIFYIIDAGLNFLNYFLNANFHQFPVSIIVLPNFLSLPTSYNWVTYSEEELNASFNIEVLSILLARLTQLYFGVNVTQNWWSSNWMDVGLSLYTAYILANEIDPNIRAVEHFAVNIRQIEMEDESHGHTRLLDRLVTLPKEIILNFDDVAKRKGAALFGMIHNYLGDEEFYKLLFNYLCTMDSKTVTTNDLYVFVEKFFNSSTVGNYQLNTVFESWSQEFYPLVTVNYNRHLNEVTFTQTPFCSFNVNCRDKSNSWIIPVNYVTNLNTGTQLPIFWFNDTYVLNNFTDDWLIVNKDQSGYYRVNYDEETWRRIIFHIIHVPYLPDFDSFSLNWFQPLLSPLMKSQLLDDSFALSQAKIIKFQIHLDLTKLFLKERDEIVWQTGYRFFNEMQFKVAMTTTNRNFQLYWKTTLNTQVFGRDAFLGYVLKEMAVTLRIMEYGSYVTVSVENDLKNNFTLCQFPTQCCAAVIFSNEIWNQLFEKSLCMVDESDMSFERTLFALGCTSNLLFLNQYFEKYFISNITEKNKILMIKSLSSNLPDGSNFIFNIMITNFSLFAENFSNTALKKVVSIVAKPLGTRKYLSQISAAIEKYSDYKEILQISLKIIEYNVQWNDEFLYDIDYWLAEELYMSPNIYTVTPVDLINETTSTITSTTLESTSQQPNGAFVETISIHFACILFLIVVLCEVI